MLPIAVRPETPQDDHAITHVTQLAFAHHPHSQQTEHFIVRALRQAGALSLSLVAEHAGQVVGHVAFSPITLGDGSPDWYILGPVSVLPEKQRQGVGIQLIQRGLAQLRQRHAAGCMLVGDLAYYHRLGFSLAPQFTLADVPPQYILAITFGDVPAQGEVTIHPAFHATA